MKTLVVIFVAVLFSSAAFAGTKSDDRRTARAKDQEGLALLESGDVFAAADAFSEAITLAPDRALYHNHYGLALLYMDDPLGAAMEFEAAIDLGLTGDYIWNNLGMAYEHLGELEAAREAYQQAEEKGSVLAAGHLRRLANVKALPRPAEDSPGC